MLSPDGISGSKGGVGELPREEWGEDGSLSPEWRTTWEELAVAEGAQRCPQESISGNSVVSRGVPSLLTSLPELDRES